MISTNGHPLSGMKTPHINENFYNSSNIEIMPIPFDKSIEKDIRG